MHALLMKFLYQFLLPEINITLLGVCVLGRGGGGGGGGKEEGGDVNQLHQS